MPPERLKYQAGMIEMLGMMFCPNCKEYKGIVFDEEEDSYICIFCE